MSESYRMSLPTHALTCGELHYTIHYSFCSLSYDRSTAFSEAISPQSTSYEGHLESKERFAIQRYLLIIGKKKNMQVL